jgi:hypothetical protein
MSDNDPDVDRDADVFRVWCDDCDLDVIYDSDDPPQRTVEYYGSVEKARRSWDPYSSALGKYDHHKTVFRDYENGLRHRPNLDAVDE